jgi:hypothetical protein
MYPPGEPIAIETMKPAVAQSIKALQASLSRKSPGS